MPVFRSLYSLQKMFRSLVRFSSSNSAKQNAKVRLKFDATRPENELIKQKFLKMEKDVDLQVELGRLTHDELVIYTLHRQACERWQLNYFDLSTGLQVSTRLKHFLRGKCCGSGCRHCPYQHREAKPEIRNNKRFNTAFYVDLSVSPVSSSKK